MIALRPGRILRINKGESDPLDDDLMIMGLYLGFGCSFSFFVTLPSSDSGEKSVGRLLESWESLVERGARFRGVVGEREAGEKGRTGDRLMSLWTETMAV